MNILIFYLVTLFFVVELKERSEELDECINLEKTVVSPSDCLNIKIPSSEGYKCCSMKITYNNESSYNCLALENKYTINKEVLSEYISQRDISFLFITFGGQIDIDCDNNIKTSENYKKLSNEYLSCYNNHIKGIENENDCIQNDIPVEEGSKCCFVETTTEYDNGNFISDKRCYLIEDEYFTKNKNLNNYLLDKSGIKNFDEVINTNVTIRCKNLDTYFFSSINNDIKYSLPSNLISDNNIDFENNNDSSIISDFIENSGQIRYEPLTQKKNSGKKTWVIILIIIVSLILIGIIIILIICFYCRKKNELSQLNITDSNKLKVTSQK